MAEETHSFTVQRISSLEECEIPHKTQVTGGSEIVLLESEMKVSGSDQGE